MRTKTGEIKPPYEDDELEELCSTPEGTKIYLREIININMKLFHNYDKDVGTGYGKEKHFKLAMTLAQNLEEYSVLWCSGLKARDMIWETLGVKRRTVVKRKSPKTGQVALQKISKAWRPHQKRKMAF